MRSLIAALLCVSIFIAEILANPLTLISDSTFGNKTYTHRYATTMLKRKDQTRVYAIYGELQGGHKEGLYIATLDNQLNLLAINKITEPQGEDGTITVRNFSYQV